MKNYTISIIGEEDSQGDDTERFELITDGRFSRRGGVSKISYNDSDVTGAHESFETTFVVEKDRVTLTRDVWFGQDMVFDRNEKHHFLYETPDGSYAMGVRTEYLKQELTDKGGNLYIKYSLDVDDIVWSRHTFKISVSPDKTDQTPAKPRRKKQGDTKQ